MCIAVYIPKHYSIPRRKLEAMHRSNPDGCGILSSEYSQFYVKRGLMSFDKFYRHLLNAPATSDIILHFRTASSSNISEEACHPLKVHDNLMFVHNGNLFEFSDLYHRPYKDGLSDSQRFNRDILQKFPKDFIEALRYRSLLSQYARSNHSKFIFMDSLGNVDMINPVDFIVEDGIWYSNGGIQNYTGYGFSGVYNYGAGNNRHKGGIRTPFVFPQTKRDGWHQCRRCTGYYKDPLYSHGTGTPYICESCVIYERLTSLARG